MNAHLVQSPLAQAEARLIMGAELQYISGTDGGVLRGLIQDHVDGQYDWVLYIVISPPFHTLTFSLHFLKRV